MGQSWFRLTPVKMVIRGVAEDVLVFGGGYDENQDRGNPRFETTHTSDSRGRGLNIVRATTGQLLWSGLGLPGGSKTFADMNYGFNGNIRTIDINRDGYVDQMYAADVGGQLWRFDMTPNHADASVDLVHGGVIADISNDTPVNHRRFYNEPDVALIEGNGERFLSLSIGSGWRANPLDELTQDRLYMFRQYAVYEKPAGYGKLSDTSYMPLAESDLVNVTSSVNPEVNKFGWFLDFQHSGEKVLGTSVTFDNTVIFTTYVPTAQTNACAAEIGSGRAYVMDVVNGAPVANLDGSGSEVLSVNDLSKGLTRTGIPPDAMILLTESGGDVPQILIGGEKLDAGVSNRTRRTFWSDEGKSGELLVTGGEDD
ncbi:MAG: hypothetical protein AB8B97_28140 [Granulosicoccus sp.]